MAVVNAESTVDETLTEEIKLIQGLNFSHGQYDLV